MKKVFLLGNPRSGTSLLRLMMNSHPAIVSPPESGFLHWWKKKYFDWRWNNKSLSRLNEFIVDLASSKKIETWNLDYGTLTDFIVSKKPGSYSSLIEMVYVFYGISIGKEPTIVVDKNNYYIHHLPELKEVWPDASYIQLVRDGRDVACSYLEMKSIASDSIYKPVLTDNIEEIAKEWSTNNQKVYRFIAAEPVSNTIIIRYEDLILDTAKTLHGVCDFLGVSYDAIMMNYHHAKNHDEPKETLDWKKRTLAPPDLDRVGRYKSILTKKDIDTFNAIAKETLLQFNYSIS